MRARARVCVCVRLFFAARHSAAAAAAAALSVWLVQAHPACLCLVCECPPPPCPVFSLPLLLLLLAFMAGGFVAPCPLDLSSRVCTLPRCASPPSLKHCHAHVCFFKPARNLPLLPHKQNTLTSRLIHYGRAILSAFGQSDRAALGYCTPLLCQASKTRIVFSLHSDCHATQALFAPLPMMQPPPLRMF